MIGGESSEANSVPVGISPKLRKDTANGEGSQGAVQAGRRVGWEEYTRSYYLCMYPRDLEPSQM